MNNPALMTAISQNQQAFLQLMTGGGTAAGGAQAGAGAGGAAPPQGENVIRLTQEESAAIQRIKSMGLNVPDSLIIEVFILSLFKLNF